MGYEELAAKYITGVGGLLDWLRFENLGQPERPGEPEMEAAVWVLTALTHPSNRPDLHSLLAQSHLRDGDKPLAVKED